MFKKLMLFLTVLLMMNACMNTKNVENKAIDRANMDESVAPGEDFNLYASGEWMKNNPIPDEYSRYGSFTELAERNLNSLKTIVDEASSAPADKGTVAQQIGDFYASGMDTATIQALGVDALAEDFAALDALQNASDVAAAIGTYQRLGAYPAFYPYTGQDKKNTDIVLFQLSQGGLGLPDRDYYSGKDARSKELREAYQEYMKDMLVLAGDEQAVADQKSEVIMEIESKLADASFTRKENRDPDSTYNKVDLAGLKEMAPNFDWDAYMEAINVSNPEYIIVRQPKFFENLSAMMKDVPLEDWKTYLKWNVLNRSASALSPEFENRRFAFYGTSLSGQPAQQPRWKRTLQRTSNGLGEAFGQLFVEKYFPPQAKERMVHLVANLKEAMGERIHDLDWMSEETKTKALEKLATMNVKIGYPDEWIDYSTVDISPDHYLKNIRNANAFDFDREMTKVDQPVDRGEWGMFPQTVNAYYSPTMNEIVFPAAILQPPFFFMDADDAVNYGAIGVVIGHEMTHGFDDQGRKYDKNGNMNSWWTDEDAGKFKERTDVLVNQFNNFVVFDSLHVDGELTLGENIADLGGLNISWQAFQKALNENGRPADIEGFSPEQRFFLSYAQVWKQNIRDKELMRRVKEDVHSPGAFRVNGPLFNMPQFYEAFPQVKEGDKLYIAESDRAKIW